MQPESELVTGDAVVLELRLATLASRGVAFALDVLVQFAALFLFFLVLGAVGFADQALAIAVMLTLFVLVRVGYPVIFETLAGGRTLGKMALGLRVVRDDGGPIRFRHALARGLAGAIVDFGPVLLWSAVAIVVSLCSGKSKRVGDFLAGTVVIRERVPQASAPMLMMPPPLAPWASQLDLSGLNDDLALAIRQYLGRMAELRPEARDALGYQLAQEVGARLNAPLPPGVPVWAYLTAILAERRARDQARMLGYAPAAGVQPGGMPPYRQQPTAPGTGSGWAPPAPDPGHGWAPSATDRGHGWARPPEGSRPEGAAPEQPVVENPFTPPS
ncbi:RDD family protein [Amycolatopsis anabasis]|uniref:RDD family protein n=1 Tax=Amycolatopsis anabasis TaxID=1840409 RepID=UPI00131ACCC5|nr:RDD family protein [Amycolatopsis anabasis]